MRLLVLLFLLVQLCQTVVSDKGVPLCLGVGVVGSPVISVVAGEVSVVVSTTVVTTARVPESLCCCCWIVIQ